LLDSATEHTRLDIQSEIAEKQSEPRLFETRRDIVHTMVEFVGSTPEGVESTAPASQTEALGHSVPAALTVPSDATGHAESNSAFAYSHRRQV
jgi:hypothetical protein